MRSRETCLRMEMLLGWGEAMRRNETARDFFIVPLLVGAGQFFYCLSLVAMEKRGRQFEIRLPLKTIHWSIFLKGVFLL